MYVWEHEETMIINLEHFHWMHYCIFFKIVLENFRWNYSDWEIHLFLFWWRVTWPDLCFVHTTGQDSLSVISIYFCCQKCLWFFRDSLWSVNTESQIAIDVLYTPFFLCWWNMSYASNDAQILGFDILLSVHGFSLYFWCLGCSFRLICLGPYWMEVSTWKNYTQTLYVWETSRF